MKKLVLLSVTSLSILFGSVIYKQYQQEQKESYWLTFANRAVVNNDVKFVEFYQDYLFSLHTLSIEEGWNLYERYINKK